MTDSCLIIYDKYCRQGSLTFVTEFVERVYQESYVLWSQWFRNSGNDCNGVLHYVRY